MLMNNLDPDVAERPEDLVVYGGTGRAARSWAAFDAIVASLRDLDDDETLLVQSGKPVGVFRTHEWAPRVLIANANLVPDWADWDEFRRLEALGLTMYGQMTAGSWIYIGTQGILQGTYECFSAIAERRFEGSLAGTVTLTSGLGGMGGAQPLAVTMNGGVAIVVEVDPAPHPPPPRDPLPRRRRRRSRRRPRPGRGRPRRPPGPVDRRAGQRGRGAAPPGRDGRPRRHRHRPDPRPRPAQLRPGRPVARRGRRPPLAATPAGYTEPRPSLDGRATARPWSPSPTAASRCSTTATACGGRPSSAGSSGRSTTPASSPRTSARCSARARARSGGRRCRATPPTSAPPTGPSSTSSPTTRRSPAGSDWPSDRVAFQGLPARICWLGARRAPPRRPALQRAGRQRAGGRRRSSSGATTSTRARSRRRTARPRRCATAPTPSPTGRCSTPCSTPPAGRAGSRSTTAAASASAGRSTPAWWWWPTAPTSPPRSWSGCSRTTPASGVARHADAGYPEALRVARATGLRLPMQP